MRWKIHGRINYRLNITEKKKVSKLEIEMRIKKIRKILYQWAVGQYQVANMCAGRVYKDEEGEVGIEKIFEEMMPIKKF